MEVGKARYQPAVKIRRSLIGEQEMGLQAGRNRGAKEKTASSNYKAGNPCLRRSIWSRICLQQQVTDPKKRSQRGAEMCGCWKKKKNACFTLKKSSRPG